MKALDTNVLIRFLVNDDKKQALQAKAALAKAESQGHCFMIVTPVVLELIWVLSKVYEYAREDIINALEQLLFMPVIAFEHPQRIHRLVLLGRKTSLELSDLLIGICGQDTGSVRTLTFDKKATRSSLFNSF